MLQRILALFRTPAHAVKETEWGERIAVALTENGIPSRDEVRLFDGTRVDIITPHHAVEIDWAPKWAEAIGQALYYSCRSKKKPVALLLMERSADEAFVIRCRAVCTSNKPQITIWLFNTTTKMLHMEDNRVIKVR